jgi:hypothetical protein
VRRLLLLVPLALLIAAPPASGGGFATVGLSSTPEGTSPGQPWTPDITVLAHGRTPVDGLTTTVRISSGDTTREFRAGPSGTPGGYRADVVFPDAGWWSYEVEVAEYGLVSTYPAVKIGDGAGAPAAPAAQRTAPAALADDDGGIAAGWLWGAGAALLLALAVLGLDRRRRVPAPAA